MANTSTLWDRASEASEYDVDVSVHQRELKDKLSERSQEMWVLVYATPGESKETITIIWKRNVMFGVYFDLKKGEGEGE